MSWPLPVFLRSNILTFRARGFCPKAAQTNLRAYNQEEQFVYGIITTGNNWLFLRLKEGMTIEVDVNSYPLNDLEKVLGILQHIIDKFK